MKSNLLLLILLIQAVVFGQEKKGNFLEKLDKNLTGLVNTLETAKGKDYVYATLKGSWENLSAGGKYNNEISVRNHFYEFIIDQDIEEFKIETSPNILVIIYDEFENKVFESIGFNRKIKKGTYKFLVFADRDFSGKYEIKFFHKIKSAKKIEIKNEVLANQSFDSIEGGGGGRYHSILSPRNPVYEFELKKDEFFDITIRKKGIKIASYLISPFGEKINSQQDLNDNPYFIAKAKETGIYKLIIISNEINSTGQFNIESVGDFISFPKLKPILKENKLDKWTEKNINTYKIDYEIGNQEILLRSSSGKVQINLKNSENSAINQSNLLSEYGLKNTVFNVNRKGIYYLEVETDNPNGGDYELILFGNFSKIEKINDAMIDLKIINNGLSYYLESNLIKVNNLTQSKSFYLSSKVENGLTNFKLEKGFNYNIELNNDHIFSEIININLTTEAKDKYNYQIKVSNFELGYKVNLMDFYFLNGKSDLSEISKIELERIAKKFSKSTFRKIEIEIFSNDKKTQLENINLSNNRKKIFQDYLLKLGISNENIKIITLPIKGYSFPKKEQIEIKLI